MGKRSRRRTNTANDDAMKRKHLYLGEVMLRGKEEAVEDNEEGNYRDRGELFTWKFV